MLSHKPHHEPEKQPINWASPVDHMSQVLLSRDAIPHQPGLYSNLNFSIRGDNRVTDLYHQDLCREPDTKPEEGQANCSFLIAILNSAVQIFSQLRKNGAILTFGRVVWRERVARPDQGAASPLSVDRHVPCFWINARVSMRRFRQRVGKR